MTPVMIKTGTKIPNVNAKYANTVQVGGANAGSRFIPKMIAKTTRISSTIQD
jgi:hypothetical protein